ncbi:MAG: DTW domain-containing protein [Deltaproteobacteria bacterium]|nr:DTW domain-containing protein [Deltaproteobacteria bacterium]MBI3387061.1 DTW domain-containing protein [Deltaproteobacteria bacterium]
MPSSTQPRTASAIRHRLVCYDCFKPQVACVCASIEPVANRTGIIILQHPRERFHAVGTARIARLGLVKVRVESRAPRARDSAMSVPFPARTALLYPTNGAQELAAMPVVERPQNLVVLDGTWFHAKKIYDAYQWLRDLPHVSLTPSEPSRYRIRREPKPHYVATLEAIVCALRIIEPHTRGLDGLLRSFAAMIDRQAAYTPTTKKSLVPSTLNFTSGGG